MTATQPESDRGMTRRGVMRRTALGIGATATAGYGLASDRGAVGDAQAFPPALVPAAAAVGVLAYGELIAGPDDSEVDGALSYDNHLSEYTRAVEDQLQTSEILASLERDAQLVPNKAREEAIFAVYEAGVEGLSEADATTAAEEAIQDSFATVQHSVLNSWQLRYARLESMIGTNLVPVESSDVIYTYDPVSGSSTFVGGGDNNNPSFAGYRQNSTDVTLVNGDIVTVKGDYYLSGAGTSINISPLKSHSYSDPTYYSQVRVAVPDANNYAGVDSDTHDFTDDVVALDSEPWSDVYDRLMDEYNQMMDEVTSIVDTYYQAAVDGDIDLHNMMGPAHLTDTASTAEDYQEAAMALRGMGYSISQQIATVSIADPDETDEDGNPVTHERFGRLAWNAHEGNGLGVGSELNPDNIVGTVFFAYNEDHDDGTTTGEIRELSRPFTIESADGASHVTFEDRTLVEADTTLTQEEIEALFREHYEANEEARNNVHDTATTGGGGGGGLLDGGAGDAKTLGIVAGAAALAALLFGNK